MRHLPQWTHDVQRQFHPGLRGGHRAAAVRAAEARAPAAPAAGADSQDVSDEPLIPGPLYGLRTWQVAAEDGVERLAAPHRGITWPTGAEWLEARCERHPAPGPDCDCGIHGWHPRRSSARRVLATRREVAGIVEAEGEIEVYHEGFRAERARPYALVVVPGRNADQIGRLAEEYGVPVIDVGGAEALLAWCTERDLGLSESVVSELVGPSEKPIRKSGALRFAAAVAVAVLLVIAGIELIPDQESGKVLKGRSGEIRTP
jgi:hypothetical protein